MNLFSPLFYFLCRILFPEINFDQYMMFLTKFQLN